MSQQAKNTQYFKELTGALLLYAIVLIGLGLEVFSMNPSSIPVIKNVVRSVRYRDCRRIAETALEKRTAQEIEEFVIESVAMRFPEGLVNKGT